MFFDVLIEYENVGERRTQKRKKLEATEIVRVGGRREGELRRGKAVTKGGNRMRAAAKRHVLRELIARKEFQYPLSLDTKMEAC